MKNFTIKLLFLSICYASVQGSLTDLHKAIEVNNIRNIKTILQREKRLLNQLDAHGFSPLHVAVRFNRLEAVKALVQSGCQIDLKDTTLKTPSKYAKELGYLDIHTYLRSQKNLEKTLGYKFKKRKKLIKACTCRSANPESNCEVYELLGDTVLHLALTEILINKYPNAQEGKLTHARVALEQNAMLALVAEKLELSAYINANEPINYVVTSDTIEALVGAIYKDGGASAAQQLVERFWAPMLNDKSQPPIAPKLLIRKWEKETNQAQPMVFPTASNKLPTIQGNLDALQFIKTLPMEYQDLSPILPTDPEYILTETAEPITVAPQWGETIMRNSRLKLTNVAQALSGEQPRISTEESGGRFIALVDFNGNQAREVGSSKTEGQEKAAQVILDQWYQSLSLAPELQNKIEALRERNKTTNARMCLKELSEIINSPKPEYTIENVERNFTSTITCNSMLSKSVTGDMAKTKSEAEESAACAFLQEWKKELDQTASLVARPALYVRALTKYLGIKPLMYEQYRAEGKITEPQSYFVKVFTSANEHILTGEKSTSILEADKNAARLALSYLINKRV